ncbi:ModD protein [Ignatzschineria ureiclastica]|uniref:Putative pyrophosphorylase ModD n=1 Tax=Ignatzschineria ureiclastica TaxID=472582 RepID=A0A2U2AEG5_9GAMM|nr:ModD protein [Ignatzschineria ureiclastica]PWD80949.1 ModD protein [Ignatzschineria ureiclastica]GGZ93702.1 ModD protein [Ignatzschineria ureiclastica]
MFISTEFVDRLIHEDLPYIDLTSSLLGISKQRARIEYRSRESGVIAGIDVILKMFQQCQITPIEYQQNGEFITPNGLLISGEGSAEAIHTVWKIGQNVLDYSCGIASYTAKMAHICRQSPKPIALLTTRKNIPGTKLLAINAIMAGGAVPHRLGLSETILIFKQHRAFFPNDQSLANKIQEIKHLTCEKHIVMEADTVEEAERFIAMGADIIQFDKLTPKALKEASYSLKSKHPTLRILAAGGINLQNITEYIEADIEGIVTTAPYYAKPLDIKVDITPLSF